MNNGSNGIGTSGNGYRVLTYTSKNDFYVLNVDKKVKKEETKGLAGAMEDQRINTGSGDSEEEEGSTKSHDSSKAKKKKLRATILDTLQLNIA